MSRPIRVLELRSVRGAGGGPEKTILLGAAQADPRRFAVTVCYLRDARDAAFGVTGRADAGVDYVEVNERHSFDWRVWPALRRLVVERSIDIVHAHEYKSDVIAWALARSTGVVPLATVHGWTGHSPRERRLYYPCDKRLLARYPRLIAVSTDIRDELVRYGTDPSRITTVLNGIDDSHFRRDRSREAEARRMLGVAPQDVVIGAVGRLEPQKRFDLLINAFSALKTRYPDLKLVIVGEGSRRAALEAQCQALRLNGSCLLTGQMADVRLPHRAFNVFVQSSDYEGTPNAVLEAMALETPVIATDVGGTRELVTDGADGVLVPAGNPATLADAIESLLANPEQARLMATHARQRIETNLSFASRMARVQAIYDELAADRLARPTCRVTRHGQLRTAASIASAREAVTRTVHHLWTAATGASTRAAVKRAVHQLWTAAPISSAREAVTRTVHHLWTAATSASTRAAVKRAVHQLWTAAPSASAREAVKRAVHRLWTAATSARTREAVKRSVHAVAWVLVTPSVASFAARAMILGRDRALENSTQAWALVPGFWGQYLRRAFLSRTLARCERTATIEFGTLFSSASATIGHHAYIGPRCHLGWVHVEDDVLIAAGVHVPSGSNTHGTDDPDLPIREQPGDKRAVRIGAGAWIGSGAVVLADVGRNSIVGAGAVVTHQLPPGVVAGGVPARVLRHRAAKATA